VARQFEPRRKATLVVSANEGKHTDEHRVTSHSLRANGPLFDLHARLALFAEAVNSKCPETVLYRCLERADVLARVIRAFKTRN